MGKSFREGYREIFGEEYQEEKYKFKAHSFTKKTAGKHYCAKCGLVALNNEFSQWSVRMGCLSDVHPGYKAMRRNTSTMR